MSGHNVASDNELMTARKVITPNSVKDALADVAHEMERNHHGGCVITYTMKSGNKITIVALDSSDEHHESLIDWIEKEIKQK